MALLQPMEEAQLLHLSQSHMSAKSTLHHGSITPQGNYAYTLAILHESGLMNYERQCILGKHITQSSPNYVVKNKALHSQITTSYINLGL